MVDIIVPTLGESVTEASVAQWFKQPGESVARDEPLCELETDKVAVEVPAPAAGVLTEIDHRALFHTQSDRRRYRPRYAVSPARRATGFWVSSPRARRPGIWRSR